MTIEIEKLAIEQEKKEEIQEHDREDKLFVLIKSQ